MPLKTYATSDLIKKNPDDEESPYIDLNELHRRANMMSRTVKTKGDWRYMSNMLMMTLYDKMRRIFFYQQARMVHDRIKGFISKRSNRPHDDADARWDLSFKIIDDREFETRLTLTANGNNQNNYLRKRGLTLFKKAVNEAKAYSFENKIEHKKPRGANEYLEFSIRTEIPDPADSYDMKSFLFQSRGAILHGTEFFTEDDNEELRDYIYSDEGGYWNNMNYYEVDLNLESPSEDQDDASPER